MKQDSPGTRGGCCGVSMNLKIVTCSPYSNGGLAIWNLSGYGVLGWKGRHSGGGLLWRNMDVTIQEKH